MNSPILLWPEEQREKEFGVGVDGERVGETETARVAALLQQLNAKRNKQGPNSHGNHMREEEIRVRKRKLYHGLKQKASTVYVCAPARTTRMDARGRR
jgi:hypothetical protein